MNSKCLGTYLFSYYKICVQDTDIGYRSLSWSWHLFWTWMNKTGTSAVSILVV